MNATKNTKLVWMFIFIADFKSVIAAPDLRARVNKLHTWLEEGVIIYLNRHGGTSRVTLNLQLKRSCQGSCYQHKNRINTCKSFDPCRPAFLRANLFPFARSVKVQYISIWIWWSTIRLLSAQCILITWAFFINFFSHSLLKQGFFFCSKLKRTRKKKYSFNFILSL